MDLSEIKDPELLAMFAEYEKEFNSVQKKAAEAKSKPTKLVKRGPIEKRIAEARKRKIRPVRRSFDYDSGIRNIWWEYL